jgi:molybdenum ABC transporter molybdate-binding protein
VSSATKIILFSLLAVFVLVGALLWDPAEKTAEVVEKPLVFYCAAGMKIPVEKIVKQYETEYGVPVQVQYGGSGTLLNNLQVSGTGDLYLAADHSYIDLAREKDLLAEAIPLAILRPILAVPKGNPKNIQGLQDLLREDVSLALANPDAASIGKISEQLLEQAGIWERVEARTTVFKPTVNDVANDVKLGTVDVAMIWDAVAKQYPEMEIISLPESDKFAQEITIGILKSTQRPTASLRLARYLGGREKGLQIFKEEGYQPLEGDVWQETPEVVLYSGGVNRLAIEETIQNFENREGAKVTRVYNGCGILVSQMKAGDRPDAYFACDVSFMQNIQEIFRPAKDIARTDMVIVTQKGNPKEIHTLGDLGAEGLKIGVANPEQSALGALTQRMLEQMGLAEAVNKNVVAQTPTADLLVNQIQTGSLDAVVVYRANTPYVRDKLEVIAIDNPAALAIQPYAVLKESEHPRLMERLLNALESEESKMRFKDIGFELVAEVSTPS